MDTKVVAPGRPAEGRSFISPRRVHVAAIVQRGSRWVVTHDGEEGPRFDEILEPGVRFSDDGARYVPDGSRYAQYVFPHTVPPPGPAQCVLFVDGKPAGYPALDTS